MVCIIALLSVEICFWFHFVYSVGKLYSLEVCRSMWLVFCIYSSLLLVCLICILFYRGSLELINLCSHMMLEIPQYMYFIT